MKKPKESKMGLIKINELIAMTKLSRPTIYRLIKAGKFPSQLKTSPKTVAWEKSEIEEWIRKLIIDRED
ncbi:MAG: helix-turn-helix transcriptional regulator [Aeromonadaceae bacterium]